MENPNGTLPEYEITKGGVLTLIERTEHFRKHGFLVSDDVSYSKDELIQAAIYAVQDAPFMPVDHWVEWPKGWIEEFASKIHAKNKIERLTVGASLLIAAIDRELHLLESKSNLPEPYHTLYYELLKEGFPVIELMDSPYEQGYLLTVDSANISDLGKLANRIYEDPFFNLLGIKRELVDIGGGRCTIQIKALIAARSKEKKTDELPEVFLELEKYLLDQNLSQITKERILVDGFTYIHFTGIYPSHWENDRIIYIIRKCVNKIPKLDYCGFKLTKRENTHELVFEMDVYFKDQHQPKGLSTDTAKSEKPLPVFSDKIQKFRERVYFLFKGLPYSNFEIKVQNNDYSTVLSFGEFANSKAKLVSNIALEMGFTTFETDQSEGDLIMKFPKEFAVELPPLTMLNRKLKDIADAVSTHAHALTSTVDGDIVNVLITPHGLEKIYIDSIFKGYGIDKFEAGYFYNEKLRTYEWVIKVPVNQ